MRWGTIPFKGSPFSFFGAPVAGKSLPRKPAGRGGFRPFSSPSGVMGTARKITPGGDCLARAPAPYCHQKEPRGRG
jgi:hypothetical protein